MLVVHLCGGPIAVKAGSMRTQIVVQGVHFLFFYFLFTIKAGCVRTQIVVQGVHFFNFLFFFHHQGWLCVDTNCCARFFFFAVLVLCVSGWVGLCVGVTTR